jgi:hypothetical protein
MEPTTTPTPSVPETGTPGAQTFTCIVQPAAAPACLKEDDPAGWLDSVLGMSWAFATLVIVTLLLCFGPRGKLGELLDAISAFIARMKSANIGGFTLSAEAKAALKESPDARVAGATPVLAQEQRATESEDEKALIDRLVRKDFERVKIGDYPYLLHEASRTPKARYKYATRVYLEFWTDNEERPQQDAVEKVYYRVDDSFPKKWWVMSGEDARRGFQLVIRINGEFTIVAVVKYKNGDTVWLTRYLELPGRPTA